MQARLCTWMSTMSVHEFCNQDSSKYFLLVGISWKDRVSMVFYVLKLYIEPNESIIKS